MYKFIKQCRSLLIITLYKTSMYYSIVFFALREWLLIVLNVQCSNKVKFTSRTRCLQAPNSVLLVKVTLLHHGGAVGWGIVLQTGGSQVRLTMVSLDFFHWHNPSGRTMALGLTQPLIEMSTRNVSWGLRRSVRRADKLATLMCRLSWNLGASTSWNP